MSSAEFLALVFAREIKPFIDALYTTLGAILLGFALLVVILLLLDGLAQRRKKRREAILAKLATAPPKVQPVTIAPPAPVKPVVKEPIPEVKPTPPKETVMAPPPPVKEEAPPVQKPVAEPAEKQVSFSLQEELNRLSVGYKNSCDERGLSLTTEVDDRLPATITTNKEWIDELIGNLFTVALKQTTEGGISLKVKMVKGNERSLGLQILATDTGPGLPAALMKAVQEKDYALKFDDLNLETILVQLHKTKQALEKRGGRLTLATRAGQGSTVGALLEVGV